MIPAQGFNDPFGNALEAVPMEVVEWSDHGPALLRVRRDHERVSNKADIFTVWAPVDRALGTGKVDELLTELVDKRAMAEANMAELDTLRQTRVRLEADNKTLTDELRKLQRERDPERFGIAVAAAVKDQTAGLEAQIMRQNAELYQLRQDVEELKASKKRLKEANDRLKEAKSR